jgi:hypothetical protein
VAFALRTLNEAGLLTGDGAQANREAIVEHQNPCAVASALRRLNEAGLLTGDTAQGVFHSIAITHRDILTHSATAFLWDRIPPRLLTLERFDAIINICNDNRANPAEGRRLFIDYVNREMLVIGAAAAAFNPGQSTHTASVHKSVFASAQKLNELYRDKINDVNQLNQVIQQISTWLEATLETSSVAVTQLETAQSCLSRITRDDHYYKDDLSNVSTKQLLALAWIAIHDEENRMGSLDDAKALFIEGLCEIQRGYNDNGSNGRDRSICLGGTFNKIMEKLAGLHSAVEVLYITRLGASLKLPIVVKEAAINYLKRATPAQQKELVTQITAADNGHSAEPIWELIKSEVTARIRNEFGSVFDNTSFDDFISTGIYVQLTDATLAELNTLVVTASSSEGASASLSSSCVFFAATDGDRDVAPLQKTCYIM